MKLTNFPSFHSGCAVSVPCHRPSHRRGSSRNRSRLPALCRRIEEGLEQLGRHASTQEGRNCQADWWSIERQVGTFGQTCINGNGSVFYTILFISKVCPPLLNTFIDYFQVKSCLKVWVRSKSMWPFVTMLWGFQECLKEKWFLPNAPITPYSKCGTLWVLSVSFQLSISLSPSTAGTTPSPWSGHYLHFNWFHYLIQCFFVIRFAAIRWFGKVHHRRHCAASPLRTLWPVSWRRTICPVPFVRWFVAVLMSVLPWRLILSCPSFRSLAAHQWVNKSP